MAISFNSRANRVSRRPFYWLGGVIAVALTAMFALPVANAQTANQFDTWDTSCDDDNCVTYFITNGLQIFIGDEVGGDRLLANVRTLPDSIPGSPVSIRLDTGWIGGMLINDCDDTSCGFTLDLTADPNIIDQFKAAGEGMIAYVITDGANIVMVPFTLNGFTAAYNAR